MPSVNFMANSLRAGKKDEGSQSFLWRTPLEKIDVNLFLDCAEVLCLCKKPEEQLTPSPGSAGRAGAAETN